LHSEKLSFFLPLYKQFSNIKYTGRILMNCKIIDFIAYKIEKSMKKDGFTIKRDMEKNINVLLKINKDTSENTNG
jgi:hypothetical protein